MSMGAGLGSRRQAVQLAVCLHALGAWPAGRVVQGSGVREGLSLSSPRAALKNPAEPTGRRAGWRQVGFKVG